MSSTEKSPVRPAEIRGAKRRTVLGGAAWTVPLIGIATTAPAFAVSPPTPAVEVDLAIVRLVYMPRGGLSAVPSNLTYNANNGLYVDAEVRNVGTEIVVGVNVALSLPTAAHQLDPNLSNFPESPTTGWARTIDYDQGADRRVVEFQNPALVLAPGETAVVRIHYWTSSDSGITVDNIKPYAAFRPASPSYIDNNSTNNGMSISNFYHVQTSA